MQAKAIAPPVDCNTFLPGFQFADSYAITAPAGIDAIAAKRRIIASTPAWVNALMALRNCLVRVAGLKTAPISAFPVILESPEQVVLGFDDSHLDFRIVVWLPEATRELSLTTIVRTHKRFGQLYLRLVMPFHRIIARRMTERVWLA